MGYATIKRVPQVRTYEEALKIHDNSKPVRGRAVEIRPLGDRRDADTYWIRKNADAIELVLYKTPVITFTPDGEVSLFVDGYNSVSTHQFIGWVLGISVHGARRTTVLTINAEKFTLADSDKLRMRMGEDGNWSVLNPTQQWGWKLNRKEVTNVRTRYGEFYKYLKGFVNLRTEERQQHRWHPVKNYVVIQLDEFKSVFDGVIHLRDYKYMDKRGKQKINWTMVKREQYEASAKAFEYLIRPDQPEEGKHTNFYKAALILIAKQDTDEMDIRAEETFAMSKHIVPLLDDVLFMLYADQVLVQYQLAMGKVSSGIYEHWMVDWE
jgi:hypothetical protein